MGTILYLAIILVVLWAIWLSVDVNRIFAKYSELESSSGLTGAEVAYRILNHNGINDVQIRTIEGNLTDHYDPKNKTLNLSSDVAHSKSVSALAVAAHECGHAIQHHEGYGLLAFRNTLVPVANFGSNAGVWIFLLGFLFMPLLLVPLGLLLFSAAVVFHVITLPVELNASNRALNILHEKNMLQYDEEMLGAKKVLRAAAMTYFVAALSSILQLLRLIGLSRD